MYRIKLDEYDKNNSYTKLQLSNMSYSDEIKYIKLAQNGDECALELLLRSNTRYIYEIARNFSFVYNTIDDLVNEGLITLINCIKNYDISCNSKKLLSTMCYEKIYNNIKNYIIYTESNIRKPKYVVQKKNKIETAINTYFNKYNKNPSISELSEITGLCELEIINYYKSVSTFSLEQYLSEYGDVDILDSESLEENVEKKLFYNDFVEIIDDCFYSILPEKYSREELDTIFEFYKQFDKQNKIAEKQKYYDERLPIIRESEFYKYICYNINTLNIYSDKKDEYIKLFEDFLLDCKVYSRISKLARKFDVNNPGYIDELFKKLKCIKYDYKLDLEDESLKKLYEKLPEKFDSVKEIYSNYHKIYNTLKRKDIIYRNYGINSGIIESRESIASDYCISVETERHIKEITLFFLRTSLIDKKNSHKVDEFVHIVKKKSNKV